MAEFLRPDVFILEDAPGYRPIEPVSTSTGGFVGTTQRGAVNEATLITSYQQFQDEFGGFLATSDLAYAVYGFFLNGGSRCYVTRATALTIDGDGVATSNAVKSTVTLEDQAESPLDTLRIDAKNEGAWGDNVAITIAGSNKVRTFLAASGSAAASVTSISLQSVAGLQTGSVLTLYQPRTGDIVDQATIEVLEVIEATKKVTCAALSFDEGTGPLLAATTAVKSENFDIAVMYAGAVVESFQNLSMNDNDAVDFVENRLRASKYIDGVDLESATADPLDIPADVTNSFLTSGDNGLAGIAATDYIGDSANRTGLYAFDVIDDLNLVAVPGITLAGVQDAQVDYCELRQDSHCILETPASYTPQQALVYTKVTMAFNSRRAAMYWPWLKIVDPRTKVESIIPPSGHVMGIYARTDRTRGVHKSPAGIQDGALRGIVGLEYKATDGEREILNPNRVNVIREKAGLGRHVFGARTLSADPAWRYLNVSRVFTFIEQSVKRASQWAVFENNDYILWKTIKRSVTGFLKAQWDDGVLMGAKASDAFFVLCDEATNPPTKREMGVVTCIIGLATKKPGEFIVFRFQHDTRALDAELAAAGLLEA